MKELLNKLIEKGWKPRGLLNEVEYIKAFKDVQQGWRVEISYEDHGYYKSIREILSKESGLWQFVCEKGMVQETIRELNTRTKKPYIRKDRIITSKKEYRPEFYEYRIIESALCDEDKLEEFLLDNIKIGK